MSDAFASLDAEQRRRAEALADRFRELGAEDPEGWAASEVEEDIAQLARFLLLRRVWRSAGQWNQPPSEWFTEVEADEQAELPLEEDDDEPTLVAASADGVDGDDGGDPPFLAARQAVQRILDAGVSPDDLREVARAVFTHAAFDVVQTVDEGYDPEAGEGMPGWLLTEVGGDLVLTGRVVAALHEDLLTTAPDEPGSA